MKNQKKRYAQKAYRFFNLWIYYLVTLRSQHGLNSSY